MVLADCQLEAVIRVSIARAVLIGREASQGDLKSARARLSHLTEVVS